MYKYFAINYKDKPYISIINSKGGAIDILYINQCQGTHYLKFTSGEFIYAETVLFPLLQQKYSVHTINRKEYDQYFTMVNLFRNQLNQIESELSQSASTNGGIGQTLSKMIYDYDNVTQPLKHLVDIAKVVEDSVDRVLVILNLFKEGLSYEPSIMKKYAGQFEQSLDYYIKLYENASNK